MKYPPEFFRDGLPEWKRKKDSILTRTIHRPISFVLSSLFCEIGWSANAVSYASIIVAVVGCSLFAANKPIAGAIAINIWLMLDAADGNIARCVKAEKYGEFADALSSYICVAFLFPCIGLCVYRSGGLFVQPGSPYPIFFGALTSSFDTLMRLAYQKYQVVGFQMGVDNHVNQDPTKVGKLDYYRIKVDSFFSLGGILPIATLVGAIANALDVVIMIWFVYYGVMFLASVSYLIRKTVIANN